MSEATAKQLNNKFSIVPPEFYGRGCSALFQSGGKRCSSSRVLTAAVMNTRQTVLGDGCTTSYADFERELGYSRAIIARNVAELTANGGAFRRSGQSKYAAAFDFDTKHGLPVYHFLRTETFNGVRLTGNDALYVSIIARFYLNKEREQKYFIGGENRAAKALGVAVSTAHGVIHRLMKSGILRRFMMHDGKLDTGKGINNDYKTVYVLDDKILNRIKEIRKAINKQNAEKEAVKALFAVKSEQNVGKPQRDVHYDKYALATSEEQKFRELDVALARDAQYQKTKQRYVELRAAWLETFRKAPDRADELEVEMNAAADELKAYIESRGAPPGDIPADIGAYIK